MKWTSNNNNNNNSTGTIQTNGTLLDPLGVCVYGDRWLFHSVFDSCVCVHHHKWRTEKNRNFFLFCFLSISKSQIYSTINWIVVFVCCLFFFVFQNSTRFCFCFGQLVWHQHKTKTKNKRSVYMDEIITGKRRWTIIMTDRPMIIDSHESESENFTSVKNIDIKWILLIER